MFLNFYFISRITYGIIVFFLVVLLFSADSTGGATSWFRIGNLISKQERASHLSKDLGEFKAILGSIIVFNMVDVKIYCLTEDCVKGYSNSLRDSNLNIDDRNHLEEFY